MKISALVLPSWNFDVQQTKCSSLKMYPPIGRNGDGFFYCKTNFIEENVGKLSIPKHEVLDLPSNASMPQW